MSNNDANPLDTFFAFGKAAIHKYQATKEGKLIVDCKKRPKAGDEQGFKVIAYGSLQNPFCFTTAHLESYLLRRQLPPEAKRGDEPFYYLEGSVLEILKRTGYGWVILEFEKGKRDNTVLTCSMTFSHRHVILPTSQTL